MAQEGIMTILKQNKTKWFDVDELSKELGITKDAISKSLITLKSFGMVDYKYMEKGIRGYGKLVFAYKK